MFIKVEHFTNISFTWRILDYRKSDIGKGKIYYDDIKCAEMFDIESLSFMKNVTKHYV